MPMWSVKQEERWMIESTQKLQEDYTEARLLRLFSTKPRKLDNCELASEILHDIKRFRFFARDTHYDSLKVDYIDKPRKGWNCVLSNGRLVNYYFTTSARIARLDLLIEDLGVRVTQLETEDRHATEAVDRSRKAALLFKQVGQDNSLAGALWHALDTSPPIVGFVYLKMWSMPDGSCWFKVGVTNNPDRREIEQNVLPVAAETIACVDVGSMDRARAIEAVIHQVLEEQRIVDANNRELFYLSAQQASAVKSVLERLA